MVRFLILFLTFGILTTFNNCSGVEFKKSDNQQGSTVAPVDCEGAGCESPTTPVIVDKTFSYTTLARLNKVDILLVIDNSQSMIDERAELADRLDGFVQNLDASGIDWQMCFLTTHVVGNPDAGLARKWSGLNKIVLDKNTTDRVQVFADSINGVPQGSSTDGSGREQGIGATYEALAKSQNQSCFRSDSGLAVIVLSDEDELSCGGRCQDGSELSLKNLPETLISTVNEKFLGKKPFTFHSIVIRPQDQACLMMQEDQGYDAYVGEVYAEISKKSGGILGNICASEYASQLQIIGERIGETLSSYSLDCAPVAGSLEVFVQGVKTTNFQLLGNKLIFNPELGPNTQLSGKYRCLQYK